MSINEFIIAIFQVNGFDIVFYVSSTFVERSNR